MADKPHNNQPEGLKLGDIYFVLFRRKWLIFFFCLVGVAAGACMLALNPPTYQSQAELFIRYVVQGKSLNPPGNEQNASGVWDTNYKGVWHLPNGTSLTANDSTNNANNGTLSGTPPTATVGQIDGGASFNGTNNYVTLLPSFFSTITGDFTTSFWVQGIGRNGGSFVDIAGSGLINSFAHLSTCGYACDAFYANLKYVTRWY